MKLSTVLNVSLFFRVERIVVRMSDMEEDKPKVTITLRTIVTGPEAGSIIGRGGEVVNSIRWKFNNLRPIEKRLRGHCPKSLPRHDSLVGSAFNNALTQGWIWGQNQDRGNKPPGEDHHSGWPHWFNFQGEIVMAGCDWQIVLQAYTLICKILEEREQRDIRFLQSNVCFFGSQWHDPQGVWKEIRRWRWGAGSAPESVGAEQPVRSHHWEGGGEDQGDQGDHWRLHPRLLWPPPRQHTTNNKSQFPPSNPPPTIACC